MSTPIRSKQVRVPKAGELVAEQLRRQIVSGELREGDALPPESTLVERYGVSRPTLREAFRILEAEHIIEIKRGGRGWPVRRGAAPVPRHHAGRPVRGTYPPGGRLGRHAGQEALRRRPAQARHRPRRE